MAAYDRDIVNSKLSMLNDTQESIVTVAQWLMFHHRVAKQTAEVWLKRLRDSPLHKRLTLIYLVNEVVQQSKTRGRTEFVNAFEGIINESLELSYKGASTEVQQKLKRVVDVWRHRGVFGRPTVQGLEDKIKSLDAERTSKTGGGGGKLGGSLFGGSGSVPAELDGVVKSQSAVSKADAGLKGKADKASEEFARMTDPTTPIPTAPMHAAQLNKLMKNLAEAQGAVEASINARRELVAGLERLVESNKVKLSNDEMIANDMSEKWESINVKRKEVEDAIMHGTTSTPTTPAVNGWTGPNGAEMQAPEAEGFTPPPPDVEEFTPPPEKRTMSGDPTPLLGEMTPPEETFTSTTGAESILEQPPNHLEPPPAYEPPPALQIQPSDTVAANANEFLSNLSLPGMQAAAGQTRQAENDLPADPRLKRRKMSHKAEEDVDRDIFGGDGGAMGGIDEAGISAMLDS